MVSPAASLCLALYQPDIAQNTGAMLRTCACLGVRAAIIEPAGFPVSDRHFRRSGMDYLDHVAILHALRAHDPQAATDAIGRHIDRIYATTVEVLEDEPKRKKTA